MQLLTADTVNKRELEITKTEKTKRTLANGAMYAAVGKQIHEKLKPDIGKYIQYIWGQQPTLYSI